ncbi:hypothetical protein [Lacrimispora sp.]|jgi:hypothetical protein|uniref:hypothetical protein n=1 Tax=Lacrimispora sp. TaxID=2719234 RepID=UPI0028AB0E7D|nr:hypothetical protein [Lacrimispora sp.]
MGEIKFALIYENKVMNVFICENYELANQLARASYGDNAFAIETTRYASEIGDKYENGIFYHKLEDGSFKEAMYIPTEKDNIDELRSKLIQSQLVLTETYENKFSLEEKILTLQQIITDLYEKMEENR